MVEPEWTQCPDCGEPVLICRYRGSEIFIDPVPVEGAEMELLAIGVVRNPIADVQPHAEPGQFRYAPHLRTCTAKAA